MTILWLYMSRAFTTQRVADSIGVSKRTLLRWLYEGKIREPKRVDFGGPSYRVWSQRDLRAAQEYKAKFYRKGRGRKPKQKP